MRFFLLCAALVSALLIGGAVAFGQTPSGSATPSPGPSTSPTAATTATPTPTPPLTSVPPFPSTPQYLRAWPGLEEDSWYVYASGFTPRTDWVIGEITCPGLPCSSLGSAVNDHAKEDGTMTFYVRLPRAADATRPRLLAATPYLAAGPLPEPVPATVSLGAPTTEVAGHNPGVGPGYPSGTRAGIAPVDQVLALVEAHDTAAIRARLVLKNGTTASGAPARGVASWQCDPYIQREDNLDQIFEYPAGALYAAFRVPADPTLPLRYQGASYGLAFYDGGTGIPLGGLILVSNSGQIVGTEIRCGTTPGYHVHNFADFVLTPFVGPPATVIPGPPGTGSGPASRGAEVTQLWLVLPALLLASGGLAALKVATRPR